MMRRIKAIIQKWPVFIFELAVVYAVLGYVYHQEMIFEKLYFHLISFAGLIFALAYGIKGSLAAAVASAVLVIISVKLPVLVFLSRHLMEISFFLAALFMTGFVKTNIERMALSQSLAHQILNRRVERLTMELSERDRALQDMSRSVLTDVESPRIMYQAMRRLYHIEDKESFFEEILYTLYTHCHVEKSSIYQLLRRGTYKRIASFGATTLPDVFKWKTENMPEIMRVVATEKEVIIPKELDHRLIMAVPILSPSNQLIYTILIEEIRFINLSENLINLLKVSAFWIKSLFENHLLMEDILALSHFSSVVVYKPEVALGLLKATIARHKKYRLPFALWQIKGPVSEETAQRLATSLRFYDELFLIKPDVMIAFLSMAADEEKQLVGKRLKQTLPALNFVSLKKI